MHLLKSCLLIFCLFFFNNGYARTSYSTTNFSSTGMSAGNYLWFNIEVKYTGSLPSTPVNVYFMGGTITAAGMTIDLPKATLTFANSGSATTTYTNQWNTTVVKGFSGTAFLMGFAYQLPTYVPGGLTNITLGGNFLVNTSSTVNLQWQWGAALYDSSMGTNYSTFNVDPVSTGVGTPYNRTGDFLGYGGTGGTSYTGNLTTLKSVTASNIALGVPEPETYLILGSALLIIFFLRKKIARKAASRKNQGGY